MGTNISGPAAHHSSIMKSFQARTQTSASSLSRKLGNSAPPKRGSDGKLMLATMPSARMSATRAVAS